MITAVSGTNFKGLTFTQKIGPCTLLLGPNGSGKSARTQVISLALLGYIPGSSKLNADILTSYGKGDLVVGGVTINGHLLERGYVRKNNTVSQGFKIDGKGAKEADFARALGETGAPRPVDLSLFLEMSDQKRINAIFDLYPPNIDVSNLTAEIEALTKKINTTEMQIKVQRQTVKGTLASRTAMELPPGNLAETTGQIAQLEAQLADARKDLEDAKVENAKEEATNRERARATAEAKAKEEKAATAAAAVGNIVTPPPEKPFEKVPVTPVPVPTHIDAALVVGAFQKILEAVRDAGCADYCTARMIIIREMRKIGGAK